MIDASIPLQSRGPELQNPLQILSQLNQVKAQQQQAAEAPLRMQQLQTQNQEGQLQLQQAQQAQGDQQAFRDLAQDPSNKGKSFGDLADVLLQKGSISPAGYAAAKKADLETRTSLAKLDETTLTNQKAAHTATQELYNNVMNLPDDQLAANWPSIAQQYDAIPGNQKQPLDPNKPLTKQQLAQFGPALSMGNAYFDQELERRKKQTELQQTQGKTDPTSPLYAPTKESIALGVAPGAAQIQANEVTQAGKKAGAEESARLPGEMALARQRQALSQGDPSAAAALLVNGDATLSELKARGATPDFIANTLKAAHQLSNGQYNAQAADAQFQVAKSPTNVAFFGSAKSLTDPGGTLDQLAKVGKTLPSNQIPAFNSIADWTKAAIGSGPLAKYASVVLGVADDYAKVMGGGQGSDTSRQQALDIIKRNASPEGRAAAIEGIRGTVGSQVKSRIGSNPVLGRMYGDADSAPAQAAPQTHSFSLGAWQKANPQGDPKAAAAAAQAAGYQVTQ